LIDSGACGVGSSCSPHPAAEGIGSSSSWPRRVRGVGPVHLPERGLQRIRVGALGGGLPKTLMSARACSRGTSRPRSAQACRQKVVVSLPHRDLGGGGAVDGAGCSPGVRRACPLEAFDQQRGTARSGRSGLPSGTEPQWRGGWGAGRPGRVGADVEPGHPPTPLSESGAVLEVQVVPAAVRARRIVIRYPSWSSSSATDASPAAPSTSRTSTPEPGPATSRCRRWATCSPTTRDRRRIDGGAAGPVFESRCLPLGRPPAGEPDATPGPRSPAPTAAVAAG
jgi:hypothetical protein